MTSISIPICETLKKLLLKFDFSVELLKFDVEFLSYKL